MQINDLYTILNRIVRNYPATNGYPCKQIQTFAVLQGIEQINAQNLEKDSRYINSPYLYSRKWVERSLQNPSDISIEYPALIIMEGQTEVLNFDSGRQSTKFDFFILDKMPTQECAQMSLCELRTVEDIFNDLREMLGVVLKSALYFELVNFDIGASSYSGWYPMSWVNNPLTGATNIVRQNDSFLRSFNTLKPFTLQPISNAFVSNLAAYGGQIQIDFSYCNEAITDYNFDNLPQIPRTGCC